VNLQRNRSDYREQQRRYFAVASGTCGQKLDHIVRTDQERLGRILKGEEDDPDDTVLALIGDSY